MDALRDDFKMKPITLSPELVALLNGNREAVVTRWAQMEKSWVGSSYQARPLDELIATCTECFDGYLAILERGDYSRIRRFLEKIARMRVTLGFRLAEVQRAFCLFKTVIWELIKAEQLDQPRLIEAMEALDECVHLVIFELSEVYQRRVQEEFEQQLSNVDGLNQRLTKLSITDGLTGLYNHRYFHECFERECKKTERYKTGFALCLFDLDHFKDVNDRYGHLAGDEVLRGVAEVMRGRSREVDMAFRYGGEEFSLLLPETTLDGGIALAERIRKDLAQTRFKFEQETVTVTLSGGVVSAKPGSVNEHNRLLDEADTLLYQAKKAGRNRVMAIQPP